MNFDWTSLAFSQAHFFRLSDIGDLWSFLHRRLLLIIAMQNDRGSYDLHFFSMHRRRVRIQLLLFVSSSPFLFLFVWLAGRRPHLQTAQDGLRGAHRDDEGQFWGMNPLLALCGLKIWFRSNECSESIFLSWISLWTKPLSLSLFSFTFVLTTWTLQLLDFNRLKIGKNYYLGFTYFK